MDCGKSKMRGGAMPGGAKFKVSAAQQRRLPCVLSCSSCGWLVACK